MFMSRRHLIQIGVVSSIIIMILGIMQYRPITYISFMPITLNQAANSDHQRVDIDQVIQLQRDNILEEMENFQYPSGRFGVDAKKLADLTPETGGKPIQSVIITTWRSGSTFLGEILNAMPGNYYHYEPLIPFRNIQIRGPPKDSKAIQYLKHVLSCDYNDMGGYLEKAKKAHRMLSDNTRLWEQCKDHPEVCWKPEFLNPFCKLFPLQSMKVVRLRLKVAQELLDDTSLNVRILLLVRDPRGTMQSRKHRTWCPASPDCIEASKLCEDLVSDYYAAEALYKKYPSRFRVVRYEDYAVNIYNMTEGILQSLGLPFDNMVKIFLDTHSNENKAGKYLTFRDSKSTPFHWLTDLKWPEIEEIENKCDKALDLWGYRKIKSSEHLDETFDPVLAAPFT